MNDIPYPDRRSFGTALAWIVSIVALGGITFMLLHAMGVIGTVASAPGRVVNKTLQTDNIITSYEAFFDIKAQYDTRVAQIASHGHLVRNEANPAERSRLGIELSAMRQSCRDLAAKYAAQSSKLNKAIFKPESLPDSLNPQACEV